MPLYEHIFIARQDISPAQVEGLTETLAKIVTDNGGKIEKSEYWGLRNLQYKIKKNRKGHYSLFNISAPAAAVHELERQEKINDDVLRSLTVKVDVLDEEPSPVLSRRDRSDRDRGDRDRGDRDRGDRGDRDRGDRGDRGGYRGDRDRGDRR
ncbi:30S ribosomal protein S6 [Hyphococcus sp.]|jgi:small subunit ribosomal protein S6|uniref:30S ribosomal protein S6 n=1 Tax=Hyphococcus sp. TaxID=2038636 RepID=UPI003D14591F